MRGAVLLVAVCLLLAGCAAPFAGDPGEPATPAGGDTRADPETDRLGWENGYWHDDPVAVDASDGLNETERERVVARSMARVEVIRGIEFDRTVNVSVTSRANFSAGGSSTGDDLRAFDNAKFEALYLIGNEADSVAQQGDTRNQTVGGFYSPESGNIVVVSESDTPRLDGERTLAHELVHALQDQEFDLSESTARTRDAYNARNGLIEGGARTVEQAYLDRCGEQWECLPEESTDGGEDSGASAESTSVHLGVYVLEYFPYSDGPGLVSHLRDGDDWSGVNGAFEDPPASSTEVISPEQYGSFEPRNVTLSDRTSDGWERVRPEGRPNYGVLGQSALTAMFAYTVYDDYNRSSVVDPLAFVNFDGTEVNRTDPFSYDLAPAAGWTGDRFHAYERDGQTGYVWRLTWESPAEAREFADRYRGLLAHWGGQPVGDGVWTVDDDSPFAGAVDLAVEGDSVTVVGGPSRDDLSDIRRGSG